jgi:23S rRNA (cytosine1962-C5)-methyltransferase
MQLLTPLSWPDYELIDSGDYEKLERFGAFVLRRPEPQAVWRKALPEGEWEGRTQAHFRRAERGGRDTERGEWVLKEGMPERWFVDYAYRALRLRFRLGLTAFKHVGLFPEQAANWNYIYDAVRGWSTDGPSPRVLNLFAYTGGASLAARAGGAEVTHVDSVKQVLHWARENGEASGGAGDFCRVCEDALKFVRREVKRGHRYRGIVLDPPAYGRGPEGEKWVLEEGIGALMDGCGRLMDDEGGFCVLNLYSMGFSALIAGNLLENYFPKATSIKTGELYLPDRAGRKLPLSVFGRFNTQASSVGNHIQRS